jgi:hypothetical protein
MVGSGVQAGQDKFCASTWGLGLGTWDLGLGTYRTARNFTLPLEVGENHGENQTP